jgi:hypothetical protein
MERRRSRHQNYSRMWVETVARLSEIIESGDHEYAAKLAARFEGIFQPSELLKAAST